MIKMIEQRPLFMLVLCQMLWQPTSWAADQPSIEDYATVEAYVGDVPVYAFGYTYVLGLGPDLLPGVVMQKGNSRPVVKVKPKKSWEIEYNLCGSTPAREPKTMWNDDQPLLPIHLIDGNPETAWSSRGQAAADTQPEWIRIDLPAECMVASVGLVCSEYGPSGLANLARNPKMILGVGKSIPRELTIKLSQDGKSWNTVYESRKKPEGVTTDLYDIYRNLKTHIEINGQLMPIGCGVVCDLVYDASSANKTLDAIYTCPPWDNVPPKTGSGSHLTRISFPVKVPDTTDSYLNLYVALRNEAANRSDGFTVSVSVDGTILGQVNYKKTDIGWIPLSVPLKSWKNKDITAELIIHPGPSDDPSFDQVLLGDIVVSNHPLEAQPENLNTKPKTESRRLINFTPAPAKMIQIIGSKLGDVGFWGPSFSIGEVEINDTQGNNLALVSRGAGVQVSSTHYGYGMDRFTQEMLWPIQYDLGFKWTRVGYDIGLYLWSYVEREKGKLQIDPRADEAVTAAYNNGMNVILCLDKGNWLYHDPPRKTDWKKARISEMMETYYDHQGWPHESEKLMQGYLKYVDYMVRHFKGRVAYYEICNEWNSIPINEREGYLKTVWATIPVIKKADPNARIMLGSTGGLDRGSILGCLRGGTQPVVRDGKLELLSYNKVIRDNINETDVTVSVDASSDAEAGIILRYKDTNNFLLALYVPHRGIYFHEIVNGEYGPFLAMKDVPEIGPNINLVAQIQGAKAILTVSDGQTTFTTSHTIQKVLQSGSVGLFHNVTAIQRFDNFVVKDIHSKVICEDEFEQPDGDITGWNTGKKSHIKYGKLGPLLDAIGWHPFYNQDPNSPVYRQYRQDVAQFKKECEALGFKGRYAATEWSWVAPYPGHPDWCTEMMKAKYSAQLMTAHCGMDIISLFNETFQTGRINWEVSLLRNSSFQVDPITPAQPQAIYYVLRNISTVMDGFKPADFQVKFSGDKKFECYTFSRSKDEQMFAAWIPGRTGDGIVEEKTEVTLPGLECKRAWVIDTMNGTEQELNITHRDNDTVIEGVLIKDYPVFVRIAK